MDGLVGVRDVALNLAYVALNVMGMATDEAKTVSIVSQVALILRNAAPYERFVAPIHWQLALNLIESVPYLSSIGAERAASSATVAQCDATRA